MRTQGEKEPFRATLSQRTKSHEPQRHDSKTNALAVSAAPAELILLLDVCTQGFISGFALITPWALQGCRA